MLLASLIPLAGCATDGPVQTDPCGPWRAILVAMAIAALVYVMYPFFNTLEALIGLSFLLGLGLGVSQPMVLSIMARSAPAERLGEATGLRLTLVYGTQTALPSAFGAMGSLFGVGALFWGMAILLGGALVGVGRSVDKDGCSVGKEGR